MDAGDGEPRTNADDGVATALAGKSRVPSCGAVAVVSTCAGQGAARDADGGDSGEGRGGWRR